MKKTIAVLTIALSVSVPITFANPMDHSNMMEQDSMKMMSGMNHSAMSINGMSMPGMSDVGMPATGVKPNKVVHVMLSDDMKIIFKKDVKVETNDVVQFVIMNTGKIEHEFTIGSAQEQLEHREMMTSMNMGHHEEMSSNSVTVKPGKAKQLLWHFQGVKDIQFACNILGHAEAGMLKNITL
ncbi:MAG: copper-binding protein [Aliivibrio sp.]|uniref:copper-resistant cuproprotein CopI n=1 Tax=Aliivibrio sp. TaxID=1872443 RepID=UPI001A56B5B4|nr:copper-binding protein [Aliivibrio sp.]